jgi:hypothetical protein
MIKLDDINWGDMNGGYKIPYDPTSILKRLQNNFDDHEAWDELWDNLHHQGDIGEASYAVVPILIQMQRENNIVNWNFYSLISTIEIERHRKSNPKIPQWLLSDYNHAWQDLLNIADRDFKKAEDPLVIRSILGAMALAKRQIKLGIYLSYADESEIDDIVEDRDGWSENYSEPGVSH